MAISAADIEAAALIKQTSNDGETVVARDADDAGDMIKLAQTVEVNTAQRKANVMANMFNNQLRKVE